MGMASMAFAGNGTMESPYNVEDVQGFESQLTKDTGIDNVYVEGYIVGFMPASNTNLDNAVFSAANAVNTNLVLGGTSYEDDKNYCITVQLPSGAVRTALNLASNPQNLGHKVLLHGNLRMYCSAPGIKDVDSYEWIGEAPEAGGNTNSGYLSSGLGDFTINNVSMASELTYVWAWDSNGYAKASAYKDSKAYTADSYLISPEITLDANTTTASFSQAINYLAGNERADFLNVYVREGAAGEWNVANVSTWPAGTDWTFVDSQIDLSAYAGKKIQIAFRYVSNGEFSCTWEVKNLVIGGTASNPGTSTETWTVAEALSKMAAGFEGEAQVKGYVTSIQELSTEFGNATYFISDDTNGSNSLEVYRGYGLNGEKFTSADQLAVGAEVVVAGKLVNYNGTYEFTNGSKIISYNGSTSGGGGGNDNPSTPGETPEGTCIAFVADGYNYTGNAVQVVTISGTQEEGNTMMDHPWVADGVCSLTFTNNNSSVSYVTGGVVRWYKNDEITITPEENIIVKAMVMSSGSTNPVNPNGTCTLTNVDGKAWTATGNTLATWEGSVSTPFTFGNNAQVRWQYLEVYYKDNAGVEEILAADDSEAVYYNLQGARVNNPERGIFIKVINGKALKVVK